MAITTLDGIVAGMQAPQPIFKVGTVPEAAGQYHSHFYAVGRPGAAAAPTPGVGGAALTTDAGQIPFTNPPAGNTYLARLDFSSSVVCKVLLCDRLWHNSGLSVTLTSSQTVNSVAWPARSLDGTANGDGVLIGLEWRVVSGAGTPVCTLGYTNQAGTAGRTATFTGLTASNVGTFMIWPLDAGDTGVRSIQTYQQSATWTSGTLHLVAFRVLAMLDLPVANVGNSLDALSGGLPRLYNDTVPWIVQLAAAATATNLSGTMIVTQG